MLHLWLQNAMAVSGLTQVDLATKLSDALSRTIDKGAVSRMMSGSRKISGDELIEIARACSFPIPFSLRTEPLSQSIPFAEETFELPNGSIMQFEAADLEAEIKAGILRSHVLLETTLAGNMAKQVMLQIQRGRRFKLIIDAMDTEEQLLARLFSLFGSKSANQGSLGAVKRKSAVAKK